MKYVESCWGCGKIYGEDDTFEVEENDSFEGDLVEYVFCDDVCRRKYYETHH